MSPKISVNQLADYATASERTRMRLIQQQKAPDMFRLPWYRSSKSAIIKSLSNHGDLKIVHDTLKKLRDTKPESKFQEYNRNGSIEALERYLAIRIPTLFKGLKVEVIRTSKKNLNLSGVEVIVAPELIIKTTVNSKIVIGAVKIHSSKNNVFDLAQSQLVASVMYKYLEVKVAEKDQYIIPELSLCLDVFSGRFVRTPDDYETRVQLAEDLCTEVNRIWKTA